MPDVFVTETLKRELVMLDELLDDRAQEEAELVALLKDVRRADLALLDSLFATADGGPPNQLDHAPNACDVSQNCHEHGSNTHIQENEAG